jgi:phage terminase large subunit
LEFFSADEASKLRGGRRNALFVNECNNITGQSADELFVRTSEFIILDYNPVSEFWIHEKGLIHDQKSEFIHSTYLDAKHVLPKAIVEDIESRKDKDPNWWRVYGLGEIGNVEGLVHPKFELINSLPSGGIVFYGLDWGFSNDPTSLVKCVIIKDWLLCDQLIYEKGLTNQQIASRFQTLGIRKNYDEIFADSAEPKSIKEIQLYGYNIKPTVKGADSVLAGIQKVNQYNQAWTKRSLDSIKEQRNYRYIEDSNGKITNKPMDDFNHSMDARRGAVFTKITVNPGQALRLAI